MKTEKQTRQELIDKRLALAGWNVRNPSQVTEELDIDLSAAGREKVSESVSRHVGHRFADYALLWHGDPIYREAGGMIDVLRSAWAVDGHMDGSADMRGAI